MVDRELIDSLPTHQREPIELALMTLASSGVWQLQVERNQMALVTGFTDLKAEELAERIIEAQRINRVLLGIHEVGSEYVKEKSSE